MGIDHPLIKLFIAAKAEGTVGGREITSLN
jgi:hypothetical protein